METGIDISASQPLCCSNWVLGVLCSMPHIAVCMCVCVCVCKSERESESETESLRMRERE